MAITLAPRGTKKTQNGIILTGQPSNEININTIPQNRVFRVERVKSDMDRIFIEAETQSRSKYYGYNYIDLYGFPVDIEHIKIIPLELVKQSRIGVFAASGKELYIAAENPEGEEQKQIIQKFVDEGHTYKMFLCSNLSIDKLIKSFDQIVNYKETGDQIELSEAKILEKEALVENLKDLPRVLANSPIGDIMETILVAALKNGASDIHFEPEKDSYNLRLRLDGVLHIFATLSKELIPKIESRIKIISRLKININNIPQDGRFTFKYKEKEIDVRVSMLPGNYGYSVVMRLLGTGSIALEFAKLGFVGIANQRIELAIQKPQGLILTTGPTGSGKTTTLYTILNRLNDGQNKIITLEDPIEYKLAGVSQTQIDAQAGYTFAGGLRSILRQDPDVVMLGEIRDNETADVAIQASMTGHLVLSTIHTKDAAGSIPRLMEMGVRGFMIADALSAIIGQRLVRKICPHCMEEVLPDEIQKQKVSEAIAKMSLENKQRLPQVLRFYTSRGCSECNNLGYKGRVGVYEIMTMTEGLRTLISAKYPSIVEVRNTAQSEGMLTMFQDGLFKALNKETDLKELISNVDT